jgi:hypothetical protein
MARSIHVMASEAKQSIAQRNERMDGLLRRGAPRNDVEKPVPYSTFAAISVGGFNRRSLRVIASAAKQSIAQRNGPRDGLLRRKGSSQ